MLLRFKIFLCVLVVGCYQFAAAQGTPVKKDTSKMYRSIEKYAKKRKFTTFIYKFIFEPVAKPKVKKIAFQRIKKIGYSTVEGKIIRKINITTLDPFGYSATDTTAKPTQFALHAGNFMHIKTRVLAIGNLLLIKKNTPLDSLLVKESERLIRSQRYISTVVISTQLIAKDSVDVSVRVLDSWSLIPDFSVSGTRSSYYLTDKNFLGTGHEFSNSYIQSFADHQSAYSSRYTVPNIMNTFIRTTLNYDKGLDGTYNKFVNVERPFFSVMARWGAGIYFEQQYGNVSAINANQVVEIQKFKSNAQDYWAGCSFSIFKENSAFTKHTNFITSARYFTKNYIQKPQFVIDSLGIYLPEKLYLASFGIASKKYIEDKYVFNFNIVEDIPTGFVYSITSGIQNKNNANRLYVGANVALGNYFDFGYLTANMEYGTFFKDAKSVQSAIVFNMVYFTNLLETKMWKFRQFIKPELVIGNNRLNSLSDKISLNGETGIQGFESPTLFGTKKIIVTFQTQVYSPWRVYGFRLNPYFSYSMGMLSQESESFMRSKVYSQLSLGLIVSNDYLVFDSFQFSFSFYPIFPEDGGSMFKSNAIRTYDFGLQNYDISKPIIVNYK
jgi:hypothetical protein